MPFELLNPKGLERPVGYAHVAKVTPEEILFTSPVKRPLMKMVK